MAKKFVSYIRVSTVRQGQSGLGLEVQREAVGRYITQCRGELVEEFIEIESGKANDRPVLVKSIARCKRDGAVLAIAKLDRLARSVAFISSLMEAGTEFVAVDMPFANRLMLHLMAAFAEHERAEIASRTKLALAAAKARGVILGANGKVLAEQHRADAIEFAQALREPVSEILRGGPTTYRQMAAELNNRGYRTRQNAAWGPSTIQRLIRRVQSTI